MALLPKWPDHQTISTSSTSIFLLDYKWSSRSGFGSVPDQYHTHPIWYGKKKYHSLVSYGKKSSSITLPLYLTSIIWCQHMLMKGWWYLHPYWEKGWRLKSGLLDTREPSWARWSMTQPTPLTKSQSGKDPHKPSYLSLTAHSWCFEKAAKMLTLALWAVLAIWTDSQQELGQAWRYCLLAKASGPRIKSVNPLIVPTF